ncbi:MAG: pyruvate dehydrogenase [Acidobacteriota bacterium]|nr:pyruvate dehydrogenase [Acidobacteriota bacterium]
MTGNSPQFTSRGRESRVGVELAGNLANSEVDILERIQERVLWLSMQIVHYANSLRENGGGAKVGGHQASCASMVSLMTALYFHSLRFGDRVSVKPHGSPVYHAIQYLLGNLPEEKLRQFRSFNGLQSYPSRTKDVDRVDFSTGSVGLGAVVPNFARLTRQFVRDHFGHPRRNRFIALMGDAELDEGNVWEALGEETLQELGQVLWIVDLNRQSLDRVVPSGKAQKIEEMFRINGWRVLELKYGRKLEGVFRRPHGQKLRQRIDLMSNDEYQSLLRIEDGEKIRRRLVKTPEGQDQELLELLSSYSTDEVRPLLADLGGHDLRKILEGLDEADRITDQPVVIIAYTIKGWELPIAGDPLNHAKLLTSDQMAELQSRLGVVSGEEFARFPSGSPEDRFIQSRLKLLNGNAKAEAAPATASLPIPASLGSGYRGDLSTQQALGSLLTALSRIPEVAARMVTTSPDVSISTNLGGWIHKMRVYSPEEKINFFRENAVASMLNWEQSPKGHHIELGISENNLFLLLNMLGLSQEFSGVVLLPFGTVYDPFIGRGLDALTYAAYTESKFIFAGTPSGITLSPEGGAHQSLITPSIGMEMPNLVYYEPTFAQELEWIFLAGLRNLLDRKRGQILYLRLSTRPVPQNLFPADRKTAPQRLERLRREVLRGGYRLLDHGSAPGYSPGRNVLNIFTCGVMVVDALEASRRLAREGIFANVIAVTSPDLLFRGWQQAGKLRMENPGNRFTFHLEGLIPPSERRVPVVTVLDGHSHALSFIGSVFGSQALCLGVDEFGQSGQAEELYDHYRIGVKAISQAARQVIRGR